MARNHRVLLVEDDEQVRGAITRLLQVLDCEVTAMGSGEDALAAGDGGFELLITDLLLPGITGDQVAAHLQDLNPALRVIIVSGYGMTPDLRRRASERGWRILPKPFGLDTLAREIALAWRSLTPTHPGDRREGRGESTKRRAVRPAIAAESAAPLRTPGRGPELNPDLVRGRSVSTLPSPLSPGWVGGGGQKGEKPPPLQKSWRTELYRLRSASRCCFSQSARNW